jgi:hypothetical protein
MLVMLKIARHHDRDVMNLVKPGPLGYSLSCPPLVGSAKGLLVAGRRVQFLSTGV